MGPKAASLQRLAMSAPEYPSLTDVDHLDTADHTVLSAQEPGGLVRQGDVETFDEPPSGSVIQLLRSVGGPHHQDPLLTHCGGSVQLHQEQSRAVKKRFMPRM